MGAPPVPPPAPPPVPPPRTPSRKPLLLPKSETPLQIKHSELAASAPANICAAAKRKNTLLDLGHSVPQVPRQIFTDLNGILPPLKKGIDIERVVDLLEERNHICGSRWSTFDRDPRDYINLENRVFKDIEDIAEAIEEASGIGADPTLVFKCNPDMSPDSSTRPDNRTKPDAYGILADTYVAPEDGGRARWIDVAVPAEFKKSDKDDQDVDVSSSPVLD